MNKNTPRPVQEPASGLPEVFAFLDHRDFLREWFEVKRTLSKAFSYRTFARKAGFASHAFLSEVIQGRRNLSEDSSDKCVGALGIAGDAALYFKILVRYGQETHLDKRRDLLSDLLRLQAARSVERVGGRQAEYFAHWIHMAIREAAVVTGYTDPAQIAGFLRPAAKTEEVAASLSLLERLDLLRMVDGKWQYAFPRLTPGDVDPQVIKTLKRQMILLAQDRLSDPESPDTHIAAVTLSVSRKHLSRIREILDRTRRELLAETATDDAPADQVVQVNFQLFPLSESFERYRSHHA
ncbi:MAG: TIGR02147 family protein [Fibrobacteres bacterium]|nr:TIGR02147 family protein [Fibrobacterota bacterium]